MRRMVLDRNGRSVLPPLAIDLAIAAAVAAIGLSQTLPVFDRGPREDGAWPLVLAGALALVFRGTYPWLALAGTTAAAGSYLLLGHHGALAILPAVGIALYTVVALGEPSRRVSLGIALAATGALGLAAFIGDPHRPASAWAIDAGWMAAAILFGDAMRSRRELASEAEARAQAAERTREEEARRRVTEERLAIARELHDVVAHTVALINVQAGVAAHVFDSNPTAARAALGHVRDATHATLNELRAMVGVLRERADGSVPLEPTRGLDGLDDLVARVQRAGLEVTLQRRGQAHALPPHVDLAAYRIFQEALTNVLSHNGPSRVDVELDYGTRELALRVTNEAGPLQAPSRPSSGHGITGMRERAAAIGGSLEAGPRPGGGFEVRATLPLNGAHR